MFFVDTVENKNPQNVAIKIDMYEKDYFLIDHYIGSTEIKWENIFVKINLYFFLF